MLDFFSSPGAHGGLIALTAAVLFAVFWGSTNGPRANDTIVLRTVLGFLLLPFVIGGIFSATGRVGDRVPSGTVLRAPPGTQAPAGNQPESAPATRSGEATRGPSPQVATAPPPPPAPPVPVPAPAPAAAPPPPVAAEPPSPPVVTTVPSPGTAAPPTRDQALEQLRREASRDSSGVKPEAAPAAAASDPWDVVPVYFGTDRRSEGIAERVAFGSDRARRLELGRALVTVPKAHEIPNVERPWVYRLPFTRIVIYEEKEDPAKHFTVRELKTMSREELARLVRDRLGASRDFKDHALLFVHGFNTTFEAALYRSAQIAYDLKFDGAPFVYSWPSKGQIGFQDYSYDRESAGQAEPYLRELVDYIAKETGAKSLSIIAHSMGNQVLLPVLRDMKRSPPAGIEISQIVLAAPDVDRDTFEFLAKEIQGVGRGVTMLAASNDRALMASRNFWGGVPRAGDVPVEGPVQVSGIDTIDVTAVSTEMLSLNHSGYAQKQQVLEDIRRLLATGIRPPHVRFDKLERITTLKGDFWRFPAAP